MVHEPYQAPQRFQDLYRGTGLCPQRVMLQAMVSVVDELVGNLTAKLEDTGMLPSTVLVRTSNSSCPWRVDHSAPFCCSLHTFW